jgi:hypothetical protein
VGDPGFLLGACDVVTYPFYFALVYGPDLGRVDAAQMLWKINSNLLNHFFPWLKERAGVLTVFHFHERPLDNCPAHNVVLWHQEDPEAIRDTVALLA